MVKAILKQVIVYEVEASEDDIENAVDGHDLDPSLSFVSVDDLRERGREFGFDVHEESFDVIGIKP